MKLGLGLVTTEHADPHANVLVVTSGWPRHDNPAHCIFVKRQMDSLASKGVRYEVTFIRGFGSFLAYPVAVFVIAIKNLRRRYVLVHAHGGEAAIAARFYMRAPLVVSYLGDDLLGTPRRDGGVPMRGRIKRRLIRAHSRLSTRVITKSEEMRTVLPTRVRRRTSVVPNGVDPDDFKPMPRVEARRLLGWSDDDPVALFAGDPSVPRKRYWLAEAALKIVCRDMRDARLEIAFGVAPETMPLLMNAADCLVLPSSIEGSPNVVKEALMCNLPVVATPAGDIGALLRDVHPSYVVPADADAIAAAIAECLTCRARSDGRARSGRLQADVISREVLHLYQQALDGRSPLPASIVGGPV